MTRNILTKEEIKKMVEEKCVKFIRLQFADILGTIKNVEIPVSQLDKALDEKMMFDGSSIEGFVRIEESDMYLKPDRSTFVIFPWTAEKGRVARLICDIIKPDGTPFEGDPHSNLKRILKQMEELGFTDFNLGIVKTIARKHGLHATFMAKPLFGTNGSGMHQAILD